MLLCYNSTRYTPNANIFGKKRKVSKVEIKIICGQLEIIPGRPDINYEKIIKTIEAARQQGADILLLP